MYYYCGFSSNHSCEEQRERVVLSGVENRAPHSRTTTPDWPRSNTDSQRRKKDSFIHSFHCHR